MNTSDRTAFIKEFVALEFVALLRFVAAREACVGHLRRASAEIHRSMEIMGDITEDLVLHPPQEDLNEEAWRSLHTAKYTA
jgi:hypothetical protein